MIKKDKIIGNYNLIEHIATGGRSEIYKATKINEKNEFYTIKILKPELENSLTDQKLLRKEAINGAKVESQFVAKTLAFHEHDFSAPSYLVLEYIEGISLRKLLDTKRKLSFIQATKIIVSMALAMLKIHEKNIVHRDIKPENILLNLNSAGNGTPKLIDFGASTEIGSLPFNEIAQIVGTPKYIAPELVLGKTVTPASDIYSLGLVYLECITMPKRSNNTSKNDKEGTSIAIQRVMEDSPKPPGGTPVEIVHLINKMLEKDPKNRINSSAKLLDYLEKLMFEIK